MPLQVKTTQPRRYLVRPNQGLIAPGGSETVQIILVEKDKVALWQSYQRLGQSALDHSKDKFLVQSCAAPASFVEKYNSGGGYDSLSELWANVSSSPMVVSNKKLPVKHIVSSDEATTTPATPQSHAPTEDMNQEQLLAEVSKLRRKYDELVAFSVNLTAERDILNNTLEQTKRDLHRELQKGAATDNARGGSVRKVASSGFSWTSLVVVLVVGLLLGIRLEGAGKVELVKKLPVVGSMVQVESDEL